MSELDRKRIRIDWEELTDAFADSSSDHRYYLDRDTGAVHFFSSYLDNDEEEEDERALTTEQRYVLIPHDRRLVPVDELLEFVGKVEREPARRILESFLGAPRGYERFEEKVKEDPQIAREWREFVESRAQIRIKAWLSEVAVEPLD